MAKGRPAPITVTECDDCERHKDVARRAVALLERWRQHSVRGLPVSKDTDDLLSRPEVQPYLTLTDK